MENMDKGVTVPKWAKNTPNTPKFICPNCLPKPKSLGFRWKKASLGVHSPWVGPKDLIPFLSSYTCTGSRWVTTLSKQGFSYDSN